MNIRRLTVTDTAYAIAAVQRFKGRFPDADSMEAFLSGAENVLLVAEEENAPLGFLLAYRLARWDQARPMLFLYEIEVLEAHRRRGIGRALVAELQAIGRREGCLKLFVITNAANEAAMALYQATGAQRLSHDDVLFTFSGKTPAHTTQA